MANIYKSNYTGQQIDNSINKIINIIPQEKLTPGNHISIENNTIDVTKIDGLAGGTLTSPLIITGGDQSSASKIVLDPTNKGQITDKSTNTLFGFINSGNLTIGSNTYNTIIRGGNDSSIGGKSFSSLAQNSDIKNGILTIKLGADGTKEAGTFSANQETNSTITLPVYSKEEINEMITGAVQYLGSVVDADALIKKTPNSIGDFCRATQNFELPAANSITTISVNVHTSDILICELLNNSGNKWSVVHGENWQGNTQTTDGYVTAGGSNFNKVWKTDASGVPGWRDDANTDTGITSIEVTGVGNAITSASISERKMTLNKDTTFITSSELPAAVSANPTLSGSETELTGLQIGSMKYKIPTGGDVTAAGDNTFTGTNLFMKNSTLTTKNGIRIGFSNGVSPDDDSSIYSIDKYGFYGLGENYTVQTIKFPELSTFSTATHTIPLSDTDNTFTGSNKFAENNVIFGNIATTGITKIYADGTNLGVHISDLNATQQAIYSNDKITRIKVDSTSGSPVITNTTITIPNKSGTIAVLDKDDLKSELLDLVYPVGSIYMSVNKVSPKTFLGGEWVPWGNNHYIVGWGTPGENDVKIDEALGSTTVKLGVRNLPQHKHTVPSHTHQFQMGGNPGANIWSYNAVSGSQDNASVPAFIDYSNTTSSVYSLAPTGKNGYGSNRQIIKDSDAQETTNNTAFANDPIKILPSYIACYMWKRTK